MYKFWIEKFKTDYSKAVNIQIAFNSSGVPHVYSVENVGSDKASVMTFNGLSWVYVGHAALLKGGAIYCSSLAISPLGIPYLAYRDGTNGFRATVKMFDDDNWVNVGTAGFSNMIYSMNLVITSDGIPYVVFLDDNSRLSVMKFDGTNWVYVGKPAFTNKHSEYCTLSFNSFGILYLVFLDKSTYNSKKRAMFFYNNEWVF